jgi:SAM-dependent methyltransferase
MKKSVLPANCKCGTTFSDEEKGWVCSRCGYRAQGTPNYINYLGGVRSATDEHYSLQWGTELGFLEFLRERPQAKEVMAAARLGWNRLFSQNRARGRSERIHVYDAACGFGGIANGIINETAAKNLDYPGTDIHSSLAIIPQKIREFHQCGLLLRWDISEPLPVEEKFDYVLCRAALHHTPDPPRAFSALCSSLQRGGLLAISVYNINPLPRCFG